MSVDYSAVLVVGLLESEIFDIKEVKGEHPIYDTRTGKFLRMETHTESHYYLGGTEIPDDMSPREVLTEAGLDSTAYLYNSEESLFGELLGVVSDSDEDSRVEISLSTAEAKAAKTRVQKIFTKLGVTKPPRLFLALCTS